MVLNEYFCPISEKKEIQLTYAILTDSKHKKKQSFEINEVLNLKIHYKVNNLIPNSYGFITVQNLQGDIIIESDTFDFSPNILDKLILGENIFNIEIPANLFSPGEYIINIAVASHHSEKFILDSVNDLIKFKISDNLTQRGSNRKSKTSYLLKWNNIS